MNCPSKIGQLPSEADRGAMTPRPSLERREDKLVDKEAKENGKGVIKIFGRHTKVERFADLMNGRVM
ncbi:hypothetical protein KQX54_006622 [Cotesia glomerata]|uniref:Uncharacterized protein n=1 Tax=Cotesia glomerata TaxID=32391 RepID=A0AAV7IFG6_COTGL|nr:hypothetical protein KQX54_006622 [Cotesia glomerata]